MSAFEKTIREFHVKFDKLKTLEGDDLDSPLDCFSFETNGAYGVYVSYNYRFEVIVGCDFNLLHQVMTYLGNSNYFNLVSEKDWREIYCKLDDNVGRNWNYVPFGVSNQNNDKRRRSSGSSSGKSSSGRGKRARI